MTYCWPPVKFPAYRKLREKAGKNEELKDITAELEHEIPIRENEKGIPSLWYMSVIGTENFFDGFGFQLPAFRGHLTNNPPSRLDEIEEQHPPERPLIEFLEALSNGVMPKKWNNITKRYEIDDDWLILDKF